MSYVRYWYDEATGKVFCLAEAPSAEAAIAVHREAHGLARRRDRRGQRGSVARASFGVIERPSRRAGLEPLGAEPRLEVGQVLVVRGRRLRRDRSPGSPRGATRPRRAGGRRPPRRRSRPRRRGPPSRSPGPGMSPSSWRIARLWRNSPRARAVSPSDRARSARWRQHPRDAAPVADLLEDRQRLDVERPGRLRDRRPGSSRGRTCRARTPPSSGRPSRPDRGQDLLVQRPGRVEVALAGGDVGQVDRPERDAPRRRRARGRARSPPRRAPGPGRGRRAGRAVLARLLAA